MDDHPYDESLSAEGAVADGGRCGRRALLELGAGLAAAALPGCRREAPPQEPLPPPVPPSTHAAAQAPGRVIELHHPGSLDGRGAVAAGPVAAMIDRGLVELTGEADATGAWRRLFGPGDVVGIKVNPVGKSGARRDRRPVITSPEAVRAVVDGLARAGIPARDVLLFDRYRQAFVDGGYDTLAKRLGVRWEASAVDYDETQLDLSGYSQGDPETGARHGRARRDGSPRVSGYDPDVSFELDVVHPRNDAADPRARRSHLATIVSRRVNKVINLCVLKDHSSAGLTGALKNMSHGFFNNVSRTHSEPGRNHCLDFIPAAVAVPQVRDKAALHIMEALVGIFQGGPSASPYAWEPRSMLVATDPVALDRVAWEFIDARRAADGLPALAQSGRRALGLRPSRTGKPLEAFDVRAPGHVERAAQRGLGLFARDEAEWRRLFDTDGKSAPRLIEHRRVALG